MYQRAVDAGAVELLVVCLRVHKTDQIICLHACWALAYISMAEAGKLNVIDCGGVEEVVDCR